MRSFCSEKCRSFFKCPFYEKIDENFELLLIKYNNGFSIRKIIKSINNNEDNRSGREYFSKKLKELNLLVKYKNSKK